MSKQVAAVELKHLILDGEELAILDVREEGNYFDCHLLWASNVPLSWLELRISDLVPRKSTPIVVYDSGPANKETAARRAQARLEALGYFDVHVLAGGTSGWQEAGFELFSGLNVPSKTFGEYLLQNRKPPEILAKDLDRRLRCSDNIVVLDSRPMDEYANMSIPTAINVPGAELVYRVFAAVDRADATVVVNCAGRTRSIVGAMSLINAQIPNHVMLLKDGTMGWHLAGLTLDHGKSRVAPEPSESNFQKSLAAAKLVAERFGVALIEYETLRRWQNDSHRTLYIFDVRTQEEYLAGHIRGSRHVAGGQLVQTTDEHIAVRNSRIVLVDDRRVRAIMTASWLLQMGHKNVYVLNDSLERADLEAGPQVAEAVGFERHETIQCGELRAVMQSGEPMFLVDLSLSANFEEGHIEGAHWCIRQRLESALALCQPIGLLVLTSEDGVLAHLAAQDLIASGARYLIRVLEGGNAAWRADGYLMAGGMENQLSNVDDHWERPYDREMGQEERMEKYLTWEVQLMDQAIRDGTTQFRC